MLKYRQSLWETEMNENIKKTDSSVCESGKKQWQDPSLEELSTRYTHSGATPNPTENIPYIS